MHREGSELHWESKERYILGDFDAFYLILFNFQFNMAAKGIA